MFSPTVVVRFAYTNAVLTANPSLEVQVHGQMHGQMHHDMLQIRCCSTKYAGPR